MSSSSLENISSNIRLAESNKHKLAKAVEHLHSYSSEVLLVTVQWKDLRDLFDSTQASIQHQFDELNAKTLEFEHRVKEFEDRERFMEQIFEGWGFGEKGLGRLEEIKVMEEKMKERLKEIERKEESFNSWDRNVQSLEKRLEERLADSEVKEKAFESKQKLFDSRVRDVELRERRLEERLKVIAGKEREVDALKIESEKQLTELELKEKDFKEREKKFGFNVMDKELELDAIREIYEMDMEELQSKQKEFEAKEEKLNSDVRSMEEQLKSVKEKELKIDEIRRGYEKRVDELQSKEKEFEAKEKPLKCVYEKKLEAKEKEPELIRKEERLVVAEPKEKVLLLIRKGPELYGVQDLNEGSAKQLVPEGKLQAYPCQAKVETDLKEDLVVNPNVDSLRLTLDVKNLLLFLNNGAKEHGLLRDEVYNALRLSSDPSKLVLDVMEGFNPQEMKKGDVESDTHLIWKICVLLLEQLMRITLHIGPHVKAAAMKLALNWKNKMKVVSHGSPEVLAFLLFVCSYELASAFAARKLLNLVVTVSQYEAVVELFRRLSLVQMLSEFIDRLVKKKKWLVAVRFIYEFGVVDKSLVVNFFRKHVRRGKRLAERIIKSGNKQPEAQIMAIDKKISSLKEVLECVVDYNIVCPTRFSCGSLDSQINRLEKLKEDEKLKLDKKFWADGKFLTTAPISQEPRPTEKLWKEEKVRAAGAPDTDSKSALSIPTTAIDSAAAEAIVPPVATTGSGEKHCREDASPTKAQEEQQRREESPRFDSAATGATILPVSTTGFSKKHCREDESPTEAQEEQRRREKCPRIDSLAEGQPFAAVHSMKLPSQQRGGFYVNRGNLRGRTSTGCYSLENPQADSLVGGQPIAAVHSMRSPSWQKAGLYVNQANLRGRTSFGKYGLGSYPLQPHLPGPHEFAFKGSQMAPSYSRNMLGDPCFPYASSQLGLHEQRLTFRHRNLPNPPHYHPHYCPGKYY